jgi:tetratricopeptide (TPR) repeat protein
LGIAYLNLASGGVEQNENMNKAIDALQYGTQVDPYNADNFYMLAKIYSRIYNMGNNEALLMARENAETALKIDPYYAEVYHILGTILEEQVDFEGAAHNYEKSFMINPNLGEPMQALDRLYRDRDQSAKALSVFEKALERYRSNLLILERTARLYFETGNIEKTLELADKMVAIKPNVSSGYLLRAEAYLLLGMPDQAFSDLQEVVIIDPRNVEVHNLLGRVYLYWNETENAISEFEQVLMLDEDNPFAKEMLNKL